MKATEPIIPYIGRHASIEGKTFSEVIESSYDDERLRCVQFFPGNKMSYYGRKLDKEDLKKVTEFTQEHMLKFFVHSNYLVNLAHDPENNGKSMKSLASTLETFTEAGGSTVVHIGKHLNKYSIEDVARTLSYYEFSDGDPNFYPLLLENASGNKQKGTSLGCTWDELETLASLTRDQEGIGFCIDTQHAYSGGLCSFQTEDCVNEFFKTLDEKIGLKRIKLFHLNDSHVEYGDLSDRHANLFEGHIWGSQTPKQTKAFKHFLYTCGALNIPLITETKCDSDPEKAYTLLNKH